MPNDTIQEQRKGWLARFLEANRAQGQPKSCEPKDDLIKELNRFRSVLGPICDVIQEFPNQPVTITADHAKRIKEVCDLGRTSHE